MQETYFQHSLFLTERHNRSGQYCMSKINTAVLLKASCVGNKLWREVLPVALFARYLEPAVQDLLQKYKFKKFPDMPHKIRHWIPQYHGFSVTSRLIPANLRSYSLRTAPPANIDLLSISAASMFFCMPGNAGFRPKGWHLTVATWSFVQLT